LNQDDLYREAADSFGPALDRIGRAYEADSEIRRDLLQDIHLQLWRSFANFDRRCSLRSWVYRVAHNVATAHVIRQRRKRVPLASLEEIENLPASQNDIQQNDLDRLSQLIQQLKPLDRQIIILYLEEMDAATIGEVTGLSPANVAMKIHRIKNILKRWFNEGGGR
jgi:RNA polymerase sigma-70 factor (ECF subfamily)